MLPRHLALPAFSLALWVLRHVFGSDGTHRDARRLTSRTYHYGSVATICSPFSVPVGIHSRCPLVDCHRQTHRSSYHIYLLLIELQANVLSQEQPIDTGERGRNPAYHNRYKDQFSKDPLADFSRSPRREKIFGKVLEESPERDDIVKARYRDDLRVVSLSDKASQTRTNARVSVYLRGT
jgi:hypothetical protein